MEFIVSDQLEGRARDLVQGRNYGHISVARPDGTQSVRVVYIDADDDGMIHVNSAEGRAWPRNLQRSEVATISIHHRNNPYEAVSIVAKVAEATNDGAVEHLNALANKFTGVEEYPLSEGEVRIKFVLKPERVEYARWLDENPYADLEEDAAGSAD